MDVEQNSLEKLEQMLLRVLVKAETKPLAHNRVNLRPLYYFHNNELRRGYLMLLNITETENVVVVQTLDGRLLKKLFHEITFVNSDWSDYDVNVKDEV